MSCLFIVGAVDETSDMVMLASVVDQRLWCNVFGDVVSK
jgi:hypothetical protein